MVNQPSGKDNRIQNRPLPLLPDEDGGPPPVDIAAVGNAIWKLAQVGMGAFAGTLTGLFFGGIIGAVIGDVFSSGWDALVYGFRGSVFGFVVGGLVYAILVWKDFSSKEEQANRQAGRPRAPAERRP